MAVCRKVIVQRNFKPNSEKSYKTFTAYLCGITSMLNSFIANFPKIILKMHLYFTVHMYPTLPKYIFFMEKQLLDSTDMVDPFHYVIRFQHNSRVRFLI